MERFASREEREHRLGARRVLRTDAPRSVLVVVRVRAGECVPAWTGEIRLRFQVFDQFPRVRRVNGVVREPPLGRSAPDLLGHTQVAERIAPERPLLELHRSRVRRGC